MYVLFGVVGGFVVSENPRNPIGWYLINVCLLKVALMLCIVPHELGHAFTARWLGLRVFTITIGLGRTVWKGKALGFEVELKAFPFAGRVLCAPLDTHLYRRKMFLVVLAGPLVNAVFVLLLWIGCGDHRIWLLSQCLRSVAPATVFFYANIILLASSLLPQNGSPLTGNLPSDGKQLLTIPFFKMDKIRDSHAAWHILEGSLCHDKGDEAGFDAWHEKGLALYPENPYLLVGRGLRLIREQRFQDARNCFFALMNSSPTRPAFRALMMNNIAYTDFLIAEPDLLDEADRLSTEAMSLLGSAPQIRGTRGAVLISLGRYDEAIPLLREAMATSDSPISKAYNACAMAMAEVNRNNRTEARRYLSEAETLNPTCILLERARRLVVNHPPAASANEISPA